MSLLQLERSLDRIEARSRARDRTRPEVMLAEFERAFDAIHRLVDPATDPGGVDPPPPGVSLPTPAWTTAKLGPEQYGYLRSAARLNVTDAGRRSFKSQGLLRRTIRSAITSTLTDGEFYLCGPTHQQAKDRLWRPLKRMIPTWAMKGGSRIAAIRESELRIDLWNGAFVRVAGLDVPERIEGGCWDGGGITEFGNVKPDVLDLHVGPMMVRPGAWCDVEGTPELGAVHYQELSKKVAAGDVRGASRWTWSTEPVLHLWLGREAARQQLADWKSRLDERAYNQEIHGQWVVPSGRAYYAFDRDVHAIRRLRYNPSLPLVVCFDFNVAPGVAAYVQELFVEDVGAWCTAVIGEVWIGDDSNSRKIAQRVIRDWSSIHRGEVHLYGDATGGARGTAKVDGSDWEIIRSELRPWLGHRLKEYVPKSNPAERVRVNSVNARLRAADGSVRLLVDPVAAPHVVDDLEGVTMKPTGEIDKPPSGEKGILTHISDALGYYVVSRFPVREGRSFAEEAL